MILLPLQGDPTSHKYIFFMVGNGDLMIERNNGTLTFQAFLFHYYVAYTLLGNDVETAAVMKTNERKQILFVYSQG